MGTLGPADVLFGATRKRVLGWLLSHPGESFHFRDIVRRSGAAHGAAQRELAQLSEAGLVRREVRGRQVFFQADNTSAIYPELAALFAKTAGIGDVVRSALQPLAERICAAFIYGSSARGELRAGSDIDLFVVGQAGFGDVVEALSSAQERLGREINPSVYPPDEFLAKMRSQHHFVTAVMRGPRVFLIGSPDELERLGAERVVDRSRGHRSRNLGAPHRRRERPRRQPR